MNRRQQLQRLVRDLKNRIEWESQGVGMAGAMPGTPADDARLDALRKAAQSHMISKISGEARPPKPTRPAPVSEMPRPSAPTSPQRSQVQPQRNQPSQRPQKPNRTPASAPDLGVDVPLWKEFGSRPKPTYGQNAPAEIQALDPALSAAEKLEKLREVMGDCKRCSLCSGRKNIVFGEGNPTARLMFIGEAPGYHEDQQGRPFVGKSGQLLERMISAMGFARADVYITNVIKCRPPNNRDPAPSEVQSCGPFVRQQVQAVQPEIIVTLGRFAATALLELDKNSGKIRGTWQLYNEVPVMPTYHPSHLVRSPEAKRTAWGDLQLVMKRLEGEL